METFFFNTKISEMDSRYDSIDLTLAVNIMMNDIKNNMSQQ